MRPVPLRASAVSAVVRVVGHARASVSANEMSGHRTVAAFRLTRQIDQPVGRVGNGRVLPPLVDATLAPRRRRKHHAASAAHVDAGADLRRVADDNPTRPRPVVVDASRSATQPSRSKAKDRAPRVSAFIDADAVHAVT